MLIKIQVNIFSGRLQKMNKIKLNSDIIYSGIYEKVNELCDYQCCFRLSSYSDKQKVDRFDNFYIYLSDMRKDGYSIVTNGIDTHLRDEIPIEYIEKVNKWYNACNELLFDFRRFLRENNIEIYDNLEKYRIHKLERQLKNRKNN